MTVREVLFCRCGAAAWIRAGLWTGFGFTFGYVTHWITG